VSDLAVRELEADRGRLSGRVELLLDQMEAALVVHVEAALADKSQVLAR
jgi:hypothetical protein